MAKQAPFRKKPIASAVSGKQDKYELLSKDDDIKETLIEKKVFWEELNNLHSELMQSLLSFMAPLSQILRDEEVISKVKDKEYFNKLIKTVTDDGNHYRAKLDNLKKIHESRSGQITEMDEYELFTDLFAQYTNISTTMISTMAPLTTELILTVNHDAKESIRQEKDVTPVKH